MIPNHQCDHCRHLRANGCTAFAERIPSEILQLRHDHREPFPGDGGVRWEPAEGRNEAHTTFLFDYTPRDGYVAAL